MESTNGNQFGPPSSTHPDPAWFTAARLEMEKRKDYELFLREQAVAAASAATARDCSTQEPQQAQRNQSQK